MLNWLTSTKNTREPEIYSGVVGGLQELYKKHLLSLEKDFKFHQFYSPLLTDGDFSAKPMVLLIGQYSTGKTTFIQHLLERDYPGQRIGPEPTTDQFVAVMHGETDQVIPGNAAVVDKTKPWSQLAEFGNSFLARFQCSVVKSPVLQGITLIDTPGVLSGNKQSDRGYNFEGVIKWFAERVDLILLMFDAHKLDISDEFRRCINSLKGNNTKIRILLNKADLVSPQQLMRVYGALMWSLGKVVPTPEVARVYLGSFWDAPIKFAEYRKLFEAEAADLYSDITSLPKYAAIRKLNDFVKRCRLAKVHALVLMHMRKQMPIFGKGSKQRELTKNIEGLYSASYSRASCMSHICAVLSKMYIEPWRNIPWLQTLVFAVVAREHELSMGDFPTPEQMQSELPNVEVARLPKLERGKLQAIDDMLCRSIPTLMKLIPQEEAQVTRNLPQEGLGAAIPSPFMIMGGNTGEMLPGWVTKKYFQNPPNCDLMKFDFEALAPDEDGLVTGIRAKSDLIRRSGFPSSVLHRIWNLADVDKDGCLDLYEYSLARSFIDLKLQGFELPVVLPDILKAYHEQFMDKNLTMPRALCSSAVFCSGSFQASELPSSRTDMSLINQSSTHCGDSSTGEALTTRKMWTGCEALGETNSQNEDHVENEEEAASSGGTNKSPWNAEMTLFAATDDKEDSAPAQSMRTTRHLNYTALDLQDDEVSLFGNAQNKL